MIKKVFLLSLVLLMLCIPVNGIELKTNPDSLYDDKYCWHIQEKVICIDAPYISPIMSNKPEEYGFCGVSIIDKNTAQIDFRTTKRPDTLSVIVSGIDASGFYTTLDGDDQTIYFKDFKMSREFIRDIVIFNLKNGELKL